MNSVESGIRWEIRRGIFSHNLAEVASADVLDMVTGTAPYVKAPDLPWLRGVSVFNVNSWDPETRAYNEFVTDKETIKGKSDFPHFQEAVAAIIDAVPELEEFEKGHPDAKPGDVVNVNVYEASAVLGEHQDDVSGTRVAVGLSGLARIILTDVAMYPRRIKTILRPTDALILFNEDDIHNNAPHEVENLSLLEERVSLVL